MLYTSQTTEEGTKASHEPVKHTYHIIINQTIYYRQHYEWP